MNKTLLRRFTILVCAAVVTASCHKSTPLAVAEPSDASSASSSSASVAPTAIVQAVPFEGEIELETYPFSLVAMLKGDRSRIEMYSRGSWTGSALLIDPAANQVAAVTSKGSAYSVTDLASQQKKDELVATDTGRKDAVLGHACDVLNVALPAGHREICLARDLPPLRIVVGPTEDSQGFEPSFGKGFPLRIWLFDASGKVTAKMEATRIDRKPIHDSLFRVPASAKEVPPPKTP